MARTGAVLHSGVVTDEVSDYGAIEQAEAVAVRAALDRGFLTADQLREALALREQLRVSGRQMRLLAILGSRYIRPEHQAELSQAYFAHLSEQPAPPPQPNEEPTVVMTEEMLFSSADELAIPEFMTRSAIAAQEAPATAANTPLDDLMGVGAEPASAEAPAEPAEAKGKGDVSESGIWRWLRSHLPGSGE